MTTEEVNEILLSDKAFIGIVLSSVEVYKKECLGALLGIKTKHNQVIVEYAIPFQAVKKRTYSEVEANRKKELKINETLPKLIHFEKLGYFHSHPQFGEHKGLAKLSDVDEDSMIENEIEIVVAINETKRNSWWKESKKDLVGSVGNYKIRIVGHYKTDNETIKKCKIVCPYAVGFDVAFDR